MYIENYSNYKNMRSSLTKPLRADRTALRSSGRVFLPMPVPRKAPPGRVPPSVPSPTPETEILLHLLHEKNVRISPQRSALIRALVGHKEEHPTAEDLFLDLRRRGEGVSLATVYNTLDLLRQTGAVSELGFSSGPTRFDLNLTPHANLVCTACGRISDLPLDRLSEISQQIRGSSGFQVQRLRFDVYGLCSTCRRH